MSLLSSLVSLHQQQHNHNHNLSMRRVCFSQLGLSFSLSLSLSLVLSICLSPPPTSMKRVVLSKGNLVQLKSVRRVVSLTVSLSMVRISVSVTRVFLDEERLYLNESTSFTRRNDKSLFLKRENLSHSLTHFLSLSRSLGRVSLSLSLYQ